MAKKRKRLYPGSKPSRPSKIDPPKRHAGFLDHLREVLMLVFLAILVFSIYSNILAGPFTFDDSTNIQKNPHVRLTELTWEGLTEAAFETPNSNRPVANISFALNYYFHKFDVLGYHLVNVLIHVATGILLYLFVKTTLNLPSLRSRYEHDVWIPFITAFIWLVHPLQTQSVSYIVQRMNSMTAMFYVLSLLLYAKARLAETKGKKRALFAGCIFACLLSLGSKEIAVTLPFFIFIYEWYFFQDLSWAWLKRHAFPFLGILILVAIVVLMYLGVHPFDKILKTYGTRDFTLIQRVLTEFRVVIYYITLLIFPHPSRLNLDHDFPISHSLTDPITTLLSIAAIAGFIALAIFKAKKERLLSFCILWFFGHLVIESSVIGLEIIFEHRTYLPSMLVVLMAVTLAHGHKKPKWLGVAAVCIVLVFSYWTYSRNSLWGDDLALWKDTVEKSPKKARPQNNLGVVLYERGYIDEAMKHFSEALRVDPDYAGAHFNLGLVFANQENLDVAIRHYKEAVRIEPDYADAHNNLGVALKRQGRVDEAIRNYREALRIFPHFAKAHHGLGVALVSQGRVDEGIRHYNEALRIKPDYAEAYYNLGLALKSQGRIDEAIKQYSEALKINPDYVKAYYNLGNILASQGRVEGAMSNYNQVLRINPDHAKAHNNLGNALASQGSHREAIRHYLEALRINPDDADAHYNVGNALVSENRLQAASNHYSEALRINPDDAEVRLNLEKILQRLGKSSGRAHTDGGP
jgi:tetratricopeptide (TPR) repeat protein